MECRIIEKPAFNFVGVSKRLPMQFEGVNNAIVDLANSITQEQREEMHRLQNMEPFEVVNVSYNSDTTFRLGVTAFPVKTGWPKSTGVSIVKACFDFPVKSGKQETTAEKHGKSCKIRYVLDASNKSGREAVKRTFHYCLQETSFPASFVYCIKASGLP